MFLLKSNTPTVEMDNRLLAQYFLSKKTNPELVHCKQRRSTVIPTLRENTAKRAGFKRVRAMNAEHRLNVLLAERCVKEGQDLISQKSLL